MDWGLAKRIDPDGEPNSTTTVAGTPSYMSPEQARGQREAITTATDVYGLGTILYVLLTQRAPFQAGTSLQTIRQVIDEEPKRPSAVNPQIAPDLETICLKCLEKEPQRRYRSAYELTDDLNRWLAGKPILARPATVSERVVKWARRHPAVSGLVLLVHLVALAGLSGVFWQWGKAVQAREELQVALATSRDHEADAVQKEDLAAAPGLCGKTESGHARLGRCQRRSSPEDPRGHTSPARQRSRPPRLRVVLPRSAYSPGPVHTPGSRGRRQRCRIQQGRHQAGHRRRSGRPDLGREDRPAHPPYPVRQACSRGFVRSIRPAPDRRRYRSGADTLGSGRRQGDPHVPGTHGRSPANQVQPRWQLGLFHPARTGGFWSGRPRREDPPKPADSCRASPVHYLQCRWQATDLQQ